MAVIEPVSVYTAEVGSGTETLLAVHKEKKLSSSYEAEKGIQTASKVVI